MGWLERRSRRLREIYYELVEPTMGYPRHKESLASQLAPADCHQTCLALSMLIELMRNRRVCVTGPLAESVEGCDITGAPEGGLPRLISLGIAPLYVVTDLDADLKYLAISAQISPFLLVHVHGDNAERLGQLRGILSRPGVVYTTQVEPMGCVTSLGGFTDGDRAVLLPLLAGAREVVAVGYDFSAPVHDHKSAPASDKERKLWLAREILLRASEILGYSVEFGEKLIVFRLR